MTVIETRTTHTAVLEWPYKKPLNKDELIHKLSITIPNSADITGIAIADVPRSDAITHDHIPRQFSPALREAVT